MIFLYDWSPISIGFWIGPCAWPSSDGARPSQNIVLPYTVFRTVGALRLPVCPSIPTETGRLSVQPLAGLWQVAQPTVPSSETRGSK